MAKKNTTPHKAVPKVAKAGTARTTPARAAGNAKAKRPELDQPAKVKAAARMAANKQNPLRGPADLTSSQTPPGMKPGQPITGGKKVASRRTAVTKASAKDTAAAQVAAQSPEPKRAAAVPAKTTKAAPAGAKAAAKKAAPKTTPAKVEAPKKVAKPATSAPAKAAKPEKTLVKQKAPASPKADKGMFPQTFETEARKLAVQKTKPKQPATPKEEVESTRNELRPKLSGVRTNLEPAQPTGTYNGIIVTHDIKPFPDKTPYTQAELDKLRQALTEERQRLLNHLSTLQDASMDALVSAKEGSGYSIHLAEHASDLQTAEANLGVRSIEEERLAQVEDALERLENNLNRYGLCLACGSKIGIQRLIARPHAHLCMPCRKRYETIRARRGY